MVSEKINQILKDFGEYKKLDAKEREKEAKAREEAAKSVNEKTQQVVLDDKAASKKAMNQVKEKAQNMQQQASVTLNNINKVRGGQNG